MTSLKRIKKKRIKVNGPTPIALESATLFPRHRAMLNVLSMKGFTPYIWIGDVGGLYATLTGRAKLRRLRDQLTRALRVEK